MSILFALKTDGAHKGFLLAGMMHLGDRKESQREAAEGRQELLFTDLVVASAVEPLWV